MLQNAKSVAKTIQINAPLVPIARWSMAVPTITQRALPDTVAREKVFDRRVAHHCYLGYASMFGLNLAERCSKFRLRNPSSIILFR